MRVGTFSPRLFSSENGSRNFSIVGNRFGNETAGTAFVLQLKVFCRFKNGSGNSSGNRFPRFPTLKGWEPGTGTDRIRRSDWPCGEEGVSMDRVVVPVRACAPVVVRPVGPGWICAGCASSTSPPFQAGRRPPGSRVQARVTPNDPRARKCAKLRVRAHEGKSGLCPRRTNRAVCTGETAKRSRVRSPIGGAP